MSTLSNLSASAQGMFGIVQKAYITVCDDRNISDGISVESGQSSSLFNSSILNTIADVVSQVSSATGAGSGNTFVVQFNPSTLHIIARGGGLIPKLDFSQGTGTAGTDTISRKGICFGKAPTRISLEVTLIFDKVYPANAFKADKLNASVSSVLTGVAALVSENRLGMSYSVQPEVEAFIGALQNTRTRKMTFCWGSLKYTGVLNRVSARYTMFNSSAEPIRAEVDLSIFCADVDIKEEDMGEWQESYKKAFESGSVSYVTASQKLSSIFNLGL